MRIKHFLEDLKEIPKTWSIKRQMMVCYLLAFLSILLLVFLFMIASLNFLEENTVRKIEETQSTQATDNMKELVNQGASYVNTKFQDIFVMNQLVKEMLNSMLYEENAYAMNYINITDYEHLPQQNLTKVINLYGNQRVCFTYSCYKTFGDIFNVSFSLIKKASRFNNIWPTMLVLTFQTVIRYMMYFEEGNFMITYPGSYIPNTYRPTNQTWYTAYKQNNLKNSATTGYPDYLGNLLDIVSLVTPLTDNNNKPIGVILADLPVLFIYQDLKELKYLGKGDTALVHKSGQILKCNGKGWWSNSYDSITELEDSDFWEKVKINPSGIHFMVFHSEIYRVATCPIVSQNDDDWWYVLMLFVKESDIMTYGNESRNNIEEFGGILIGFFLFICGVVLIGIIIIIHCSAKSIRTPLQKIADFTNKINSHAVESDFLGNLDINSLKEGNDQISELVANYKSLANVLVKYQDNKIPNPFRVITERVYPPNELYNKSKLNCKSLIDQLPDSKDM